MSLNIPLLCCYRFRLWLLLLLLVNAAVEAADPESVTITFAGVEGELLQNIRAHLSLERNRTHPHLTAGRIRVLHQRATAEIAAALEPFGYYRAQVVGELTGVEGSLHAHYQIELGEPLRLTAVEVVITGAGAEEGRWAALRQQLPLQVGAVLDHRHHDSARQMLLQGAIEEGYLDAHLTRHELIIDTVAYQASSILHLETGSRYTIGPITFQTQSLNPDLLQRLSPVKTGDPYRGSALLELQTLLYDTQYFSDVVFTPNRHPETDRQSIPLDITLHDGLWQRYTTSIGYGTDTGGRFGFGWEHRRVNRSGHRLRIDARVSEVGDSVTSRYRIPFGESPRTDEVELSLTRQREQFESGELTNMSTAISYSHLWRSWRQIINLSLLTEQFQIGGDPLRNSQLLTPSIGLSRTWAQDRSRPERGFSLGLTLRGGSVSLFSDTSFLQGRVESRWIYPLGSQSRVLLRGEAGSTLVEDFNRLPASVRFFAGGDQSVRGYGWRTLGPKDSSGRVIGGHSLLVWSSEYEVTIWGAWSVALFHDIGNAFDQPNEPLHQTAGLGVRWQSRVGPLRLDLASAFEEEGQPWMVHLRIGPDL